MTRLQLLLPPLNYGTVQPGQIFRSAFPQPGNVTFLKELQIKTVLCFVDTQPAEDCEYHEKRLRLDIAPNKNGEVNTSLQSIYDALLVMLDVANYPLHIHCNQGKHRTGCAVACMRKLQGWEMKDVLEEYETYAYPKAREGDIKFIRDFEPEQMLEYVKQVHFEHRPSLMQLLRSDLVDVPLLIRILASSDGLATSDSLKSNTSTRADSGIEICSPDMTEIDPEVQVSIRECLDDVTMVDV